MFGLARIQAYGLMAAAVAALLFGIWTHGRLHERGIWEARVAELEAARRLDAARIDGLNEALERVQAERERAAAAAEAAAEADEDAGRVSLPPRAADRVLGR